jgi:hypothetical protein
MTKKYSIGLTLIVIVCCLGMYAKHKSDTDHLVSEWWAALAVLSLPIMALIGVVIRFWASSKPAPDDRKEFSELD